MRKKEKILIAMSGGVDSSVAAALLLEQGHDVTGMFAVNYDTDTRIYADVADMRIGESCWVPDYRDAVRVAAKLRIKLLRLDFQKEYKKFVLDYMFSEYKAGRTPNPDVLCNKFIKFGVWLKAAKKLGFDKLATGHYARLRREILNPKLKIRNKSKIKNSKKTSSIVYHLSQARDTDKDQTYFLHQLSQAQLAHVLFPLGDYLKSEARGLARRFQLPTAEKKESMGICFVGEVPMKEFLETRITQKKGKITLSDGTVIGEHDGLAFYTIGQRHIGKLPITNFQFPNKSKISNSKPLYVVDKDLKNNRLVIGYENDPLLYKKEIRVTDINWISGQKPVFPLKCEVRLRHRQPLHNCRIMNPATPAGRQESRHTGGQAGIMVRFEKPQRAVTPGQFAVFYKDDDCLGGGIINE